MLIFGRVRNIFVCWKINLSESFNLCYRYPLLLHQFTVMHPPTSHTHPNTNKHYTVSLFITHIHTLTRHVYSDMWRVRARRTVDYKHLTLWYILYIALKAYTCFIDRYRSNPDGSFGFVHYGYRQVCNRAVMWNQRDPMNFLNWKHYFGESITSNAI